MVVYASAYEPGDSVAIRAHPTYLLPPYVSLNSSVARPLASGSLQKRARFCKELHVCEVFKEFRCLEIIRRILWRRRNIPVDSREVERCVRLLNAEREDSELVEEIAVHEGQVC